MRARSSYLPMKRLEEKGSFRFTGWVATE